MEQRFATKYREREVQLHIRFKLMKMHLDIYRYMKCVTHWMYKYKNIMNCITHWMYKYKNIINAFKNIRAEIQNKN